MHQQLDEPLEIPERASARLVADNNLYCGFVGTHLGGLGAVDIESLVMADTPDESTLVQSNVIPINFGEVVALHAIRSNAASAKLKEIKSKFWSTIGAEQLQNHGYTAEDIKILLPLDIPFDERRISCETLLLLGDSGIRRDAVMKLFLAKRPDDNWIFSHLHFDRESRDNLWHTPESVPTERAGTTSHYKKISQFDPNDLITIQTDVFVKRGYEYEFSTLILWCALSNSSREVKDIVLILNESANEHDLSYAEGLSDFISEKGTADQIRKFSSVKDSLGYAPAGHPKQILCLTRNQVTPDIFTELVGIDGRLGPVMRRTKDAVVFHIHGGTGALLKEFAELPLDTPLSGYEIAIATQVGISPEKLLQLCTDNSISPFTACIRYGLGLENATFLNNGFPKALVIIVAGDEIWDNEFPLFSKDTFNHLKRFLTAYDALAFCIGSTQEGARYVTQYSAGLDLVTITGHSSWAGMKIYYKTSEYDRYTLPIESEFSVNDDSIGLAFALRKLKNGTTLFLDGCGLADYPSFGARVRFLDWLLPRVPNLRVIAPKGAPTSDDYTLITKYPLNLKLSQKDGLEVETYPAGLRSFESGNHAYIAPPQELIEKITQCEIIIPPSNNRIRIYEGNLPSQFVTSDHTLAIEPTAVIQQLQLEQLSAIEGFEGREFSGIYALGRLFNEYVSYDKIESKFKELPIWLEPVKYLYQMGLRLTRTPAGPSIVVYCAKDKIEGSVFYTTHLFGFYSNGKVESVWPEIGLIRHDLFNVPKDFGNYILCFEFPKSDYLNYSL